MQRMPLPFRFHQPFGRQLRPAARAAAGAVRTATLAILVLATVGCRGDGGGPAGPDPVIAGDWSGNAYAFTVRFDATFTQSGRNVGGNGHFTSPLASGDFTVTGTLSGNDVNLVLTSAELGATAFRGRFTAADRIEGTFDPSGDYETRLTLNRE